MFVFVMVPVAPIIKPTLFFVGFCQFALAVFVVNRHCGITNRLYLCGADDLFGLGAANLYVFFSVLEF